MQCLYDLVEVVNQSALVNHAQLVGKEDGTILAHQFDWATFFTPYFKRTAFDGIKSYHHLVFSSELPGKCKVRLHTDSDEKTISYLAKNHPTWPPEPDTMPSEITPPGLSHE